MKAKRIELRRAYRFPTNPSKPVELLEDQECQLQGGWLAIDFGDVVQYVPGDHIVGVLVDKAEVNRGKK